MLKRYRNVALALLLVGALCGLTLLSRPGRIVQGQGDGCWSTDNEDPVPGDWTAVVLYDDTDEVSRTGTYAHLGSYSTSTTRALAPSNSARSPIMIWGHRIVRARSTPTSWATL